MILLVSILVVVATVPLTGGRLAALSGLGVRAPALVFGALAAQILVVNVLPDAAPAPVLAAAHLGTYAPAVAFLWVNRRVPGLWLLGAGGLSNLAAISANGGVMPASPAALAAAGMSSQGGQFVNSGAVEGARLAWLGDVFAVPAGWPLANVFSVGDVVLVVGLAVLLHHRCHGAADQPAAVAVTRG